MIASLIFEPYRRFIPANSTVKPHFLSEITNPPKYIYSILKLCLLFPLYSSFFSLFSCTNLKKTLHTLKTTKKKCQIVPLLPRNPFPWIPPPPRTILPIMCANARRVAIWATLSTFVVSVALVRGNNSNTIRLETN